MSGLFKYASSFNGNLSFWNTSSVTGMFGMFLGASSFNGDLTFWNSSSVNDMRRMFYNASSFNQPLCAWRSKNFPYANADEIFSYSACTFQENPNEEKQGPFCASDCN
jgi:surface protein